MTYLFIDTETTDLPKKNGSLIQKDQARVCQLAMLLTDDKGAVLAQYSSLIKPSNWEIGKYAQEVHGFSDDDCEKFGVSMLGAYVLFERFAEMADKIIAHNTDFDKKLMQIECAYLEKDFPVRDWYCTMKNSTNILNLPPTERMIACGFNKPKNPNLNEALKFFCDREMGNDAHNAIYDTEACRDVFFEIVNHNKNK